MIEKAMLRDAVRIKELITYYAERDEVIPRPLSEIYEHIRDFFVFRQNNKIVGCCALHITWDNLAEIKSLAVDPKYTRKGIGSQFVRACLDEAKRLKIPKVFTLTTKPKFFKKLGFKAVKKESLPLKIWGECIRCNKYPKCNETAFIYDIK